MRHAAAYCMAVAWCLTGSPARADVVGPGPESCPSGGTPASCHGGPYCALTECQTDADCAAGVSVCREAPICVGKVVCAGLLPPDANLADYERPSVESTCKVGSTCQDGTSCATKRLCAAPEAETSARKKDGDPGCAVGVIAARPAAVPASLLALTALTLTRLRRRAR